MRNLIEFHYDGPITREHQLTARTLSATLTHLQSAIDRAVIDLRYGGVHKHARLRTVDYPFADFEVGQPREGGFILDLKNAGPLAIVDRINAALANAYAAATAQALPAFNQSLKDQAAHRQELFRAGAQRAEGMQQLAARFGAPGQERRYADRSINKEIDQALTQVRVDRYEGSTFELTLAGERAHPVYRFDKHVAEAFHKVVSTKQLTDPVRLQVRMRAMDGGAASGKKVGKATHVDSGRDFTLHFGSDVDFNSVAPFMRAGDARPTIEIVASPVLEYGTFDVAAGDMYFVTLVRQL